MAAGSVDVLVRFVGDSSKLQSEAQKVTGTGGKFKTWAKGIAAAVGTAFAIDQVRQWISAGSELQDQLGATQVIFGNAAKTVQQFATGAADSFGMSKAEALDAANTFAAFGKGAGLAGDDLAGFSTDLVGLAGDLASFRGTTPEQAIEAIGAALRGETEPIRAYGVLLDDATLRQQALKMGLISTTKQALTPQQKVLAAQAQLFAQTGDAQGDFERTSDSAANQQKMLQADLKNTQAALGTALLPVLQQILPYLQSFAEFVQQNAGWLVPLAAAILAVVVAVKAWSLAQLILNSTMLASPIGWIVLGIAALIAIIVVLVRNWDKVTAAFRATWEWLKANWPTLLAILTGPIGLAVLWIVRNWDRVKAALVAVWNWIKSAWQAVSSALTAPFRAAWSAISSVVESIKRGVAAAFDWIAAKVAGVWRTITGIADGARRLGSRLADGIRAPINSLIRAWNRLAFHVPKLNLGPLGSFGGWTVSLPNIPELAKGGIVMRTGLALVHEGETYSGVGARAGPVTGGNTYNLHVAVSPLTDPASVGRAVIDTITAYERRNGDHWRTA